METHIDLSAIRLFSFDFDGTLIQSNHIKAQAYIDVIGEALEEKPKKAIDTLESIKKEYPQADRYEIFSMFVKDFKQLQAEDLARSYTNQCKKLIQDAPEVSGAAVLLRKIHKMKKQAIINSATPEEPLKEIVKNIVFLQHVDAVYGRPHSKTENLHTAMQKYGCDPNEVLVVGDREDDRACAQEIGCCFAGVQSDLTDFSQKPNLLCKDLNFLVKSLGKNGSHV